MPKASTHGHAVDAMQQRARAGDGARVAPYTPSHYAPVSGFDSFGFEKKQLPAHPSTSEVAASTSGLMRSRLSALSAGGRPMQYQEADSSQWPRMISTWLLLVERSHSQRGGHDDFHEAMHNQFVQTATVAGLMAGFIFTTVLQPPVFLEQPVQSTVISKDAREIWYAILIFTSFGLSLTSCFLNIILICFLSLSGKAKGRRFAERLLGVQVDTEMYSQDLLQKRAELAGEIEKKLSTCAEHAENLGGSASDPEAASALSAEQRLALYYDLEQLCFTVAHGDEMLKYLQTDTAEKALPRLTNGALRRNDTSHLDLLAAIRQRKAAKGTGTAPLLGGSPSPPVLTVASPDGDGDDSTSSSAAAGGDSLARQLSPPLATATATGRALAPGSGMSRQNSTASINMNALLQPGQLQITHVSIYHPVYSRAFGLNLFRLLLYPYDQMNSFTISPLLLVVSLIFLGLAVSVASGGIYFHLVTWYIYVFTTFCFLCLFLFIFRAYRSWRAVYLQKAACSRAHEKWLQSVRGFFAIDEWGAEVDSSDVVSVYPNEPAVLAGESSGSSSNSTARADMDTEGRRCGGEPDTTTNADSASRLHIRIVTRRRKESRFNSFKAMKWTTELAKKAPRDISDFEVFKHVSSLSIYPSQD